VGKLWGYAASNAGFLVGDGGVVAIDTTEATQAAENILTDFRAVRDLPVTAIILTHSHRDHISGTTVFPEGRDVDIHAAVTICCPPGNWKARMQSRGKKSNGKTR